MFKLFLPNFVTYYFMYFFNHVYDFLFYKHDPCTGVFTEYDFIHEYDRYRDDWDDLIVIHYLTLFKAYNVDFKNVKMFFRRRLFHALENIILFYNFVITKISKTFRKTLHF